MDDCAGVFYCCDCNVMVRASFTLLVSWGTLITFASCPMCKKHGDRRSLHARSEIPAFVGKEAEQNGLFTIITGAHR